MTLTFELDLDILPLDLHTKNQVCMSVRSTVRVVTHTHTARVTETHRRCQNYYTRHVTYVTWGVKNRSSDQPISMLPSMTYSPILYGSNLIFLVPLRGVVIYRLYPAVHSFTSLCDASQVRQQSNVEASSGLIHPDALYRPVLC